MADEKFDEIVKEITKEISKEFKEYAEKAKFDLEYWSKKMIELRIAKLKGDAKEIENAKKSEEYAWAAVASLKAKYSKILEDSAWKILEKVLQILRRVLLS